MTITTARAVVAGILSLALLVGVEEAVQADNMDQSSRLGVLSAGASVIDSQGQVIGAAKFQQTPVGMRLSLSLEQAPAGLYSVHIRRSGACATTGAPRLGGDDVTLSGINAGRDGKVRAELLTDAATLQSVRHGSLVVFADDETGQSRRIACAVIQVS